MSTDHLPPISAEDERAVLDAARAVLARAPRPDADAVAGEVLARLREEAPVLDAAERVLAAAPPAAEPAFTALRVLARVQAERRAERTRRLVIGWGSAAALAASLLLVLVPAGGPAPSPAPVVAARALPELEGLPAADLALVLEAVDGLSATVPEAETRVPRELDEREIQQVLQQVGG
ncbi:MAG: hypothetical protein NW201_08940 [Gemmatimonadales bacterium]|nr:hypothetical protein [Gemmatimonadales bacterium]